MATSSILKNIEIKDRNAAKRLVGALEHAQNRKGIDVQLQKPCKEIKGADVVKFFSEN